MARSEPEVYVPTGILLALSIDFKLLLLLALGHGFLLATRNVVSQLLYWVLISRLAEITLVLVPFEIGNLFEFPHAFSPFATHFYLSYLFSVFQLIKRSTMMTNKFAFGGLALLAVSLLVISRTDAAPMPR